MKFVTITRNDPGQLALLRASAPLAYVRVGNEGLGASRSLREKISDSMKKPVTWWGLFGVAVTLAFVDGFAGGMKDMKVARAIDNSLETLRARATNLNDRINEVEDRLPALPPTRHRGDS